MAEKPTPGVKTYTGPAAGWGALAAVARAVRHEMGASPKTRALLQMNQPHGFDCPGCAWPDPKHTSSFEFCENGAKAVTWEATVNRAGPDFFAEHSVSRAVGLVRPRAGGCRPPDPSPALRRGQRPVRAGVVGRGAAGDRAHGCGRSTIRTRPSSTPPAGPRTRRPSSTSCSRAPSAPTISPTARTCATRRPASGCRSRSASARAR